MEKSTARPPQFWPRLGLFLAICLLVGAGIVAGYIMVLSSRTARSALTPTHLPLDQDSGTFNREAYTDVFFRAADGVTLRGWYIPPAPDTRMVIIFAHGHAGNRTMFLPEAQFLTEHGFGALLFDFRGSGDSGSALVTIGDHERLDLAAALDFVETQPGVSRIGAVGFSMGGAVVTQVAAADSRLSAVVIEAAFPTLAEEIDYRARTFGFLSQWPSRRAIQQAGVSVDTVQPIKDICAISPRPVLLIYGAEDNLIPPGTPQAMYAAACDPAELWVIENAGHENFTAVVPEAYPDRLLSFFNR